MNHVINFLHSIGYGYTRLESATKAREKLDDVSHLVPGQVPVLQEEIQTFIDQTDDAICESVKKEDPVVLRAKIAAIVNNLRRQFGIQRTGDTVPEMETADLSQQKRDPLTPMIKQYERIVSLGMNDTQIQAQIQQMFVNLNFSIWVITQNCWFLEFSRNQLPQFIKQSRQILNKAGEILFMKLTELIREQSKDSPDKYDCITKLIDGFKSCCYLELEVKVTDLIVKPKQETSGVGVRILGSWEIKEPASDEMNLDQLIQRLSEQKERFSREMEAVLRGFQGTSTEGLQVPTKSKCASGSCPEVVETFCKNCKHFFCGIHNRIHAEYIEKMKFEHGVVTIEDHESADREEDSRYCARHHKSVICLACDYCYSPLCPKCFDESDVNEELMRCQTSSTNRHEMRSVQLVAQKVDNELKNILSEFRASEIGVEDDIHAKRKVYDREMEDYRTDLERLKSKVKELHKMLNDRYEELKQTIIDHMKQKREMFVELEAEFTAYQKNCQEIHDRASELSKKSSEVIVKENLIIKEALEPLMQFKLADTEQLPKLSLSFSDDAVTFPVSLQTNEPETPHHVPETTPVKILKSLKLKQTLTTPSGKDALCVKYLKDGRLIHSGCYPIAGLGFDPNILTVDNSRMYSLYQHKSSLYAMQYIKSKKHYHIHQINLDNQSVQKSIIKFPTGPYSDLQQLAVNDEFIIVADRSTHSIKVYSAATHNHMFDIKNTSLFTTTWGLALLGDTVVIGDRNKHQVVNMTISRTPQVKWVCTEINSPSSIVTDHTTQTILVGECYDRKIQILSYEGEKLATIVPPSLTSLLLDISVHNNQLTVATYATIQTYDMKYE